MFVTQFIPLPLLQHNMLLCMNAHNVLPTNRGITTRIQNILCLQQMVTQRKDLTESTFCSTLDSSPGKSEAKLKLLMTEVSIIPSRTHFQTSQMACQNEIFIEGKLSNISFKNFKTLGAHQWLDDEVINYFINKWCSGSCMLGLNTFFACKILFGDEDDSCLNAKHGVLTTEDDERAVRWCRRAHVSQKLSSQQLTHSAQKQLNLDMAWDSVFIPINENHSHWYSAYIDFQNKKIHVYDSWGSTCLLNEEKPVLLRKHSGLMLVSTKW